MSDDPEERPIDKIGKKFFNNWISLSGAALMILSATFTAALLILRLVSSKEIAYMGLAFILLGALLFGGLFLAVAGYAVQRYRRKKGIDPKPFRLFTLNLNESSHRQYALIALVLGVLAISGFSSGSYYAVHFVESNQFCTESCHSVMRPEGIAHQYSAHANVKCVDCHVGSGAGSFVQSKLNGMRQLYGVMTGSYSKPIHTPIHNMRPAQETCESCHWRERWIGFKEKIFTYYYAQEEENTPAKLRMLMKIGGRHNGIGGEGIHYHMLMGRKVEFVARDTRKQDIAWVRVTQPDGETVVFEDEEEPLSDEERQGFETHTMDCLDCHNRPAHKLGAPMNIMNDLLVSGAVSVDIPSIKMKGVEALSAEYESTEEGLESIESMLIDYYEEEYPEFVEEESEMLQAGVKAIQEAYGRNMFPEMQALWYNFPDNIGHRDFPGCFRCHSENLVNEEGDAIFTDCKGCHVVLGQGEEVTKLEADFKDGESFYHPEDDEAFSEYTECVECHTGGYETY